MIRAAFDLVIFDCDGVLVDSEPIANRVFTQAIQELGLAMTYEEVCDEFIGLMMRSCIERLEQRLGRPVPDGFIDSVQERTYTAFREAPLQAVAGVVDVLDSLSGPRCVASSGRLEKIRLTLGLTGLGDAFDGNLFSAQQVPRGKPFPDLFLFAANQMNADPPRCCVVEDSTPGVEAARAAGMTVFGYAGRGNRGELRRAGATVFTTMAELPELLRSTGEP